MRKDYIIQKKGINEEEISSQAFSNSSMMNSENFEYSEKIYYYEKKIKLLIQKNKELNSEVLKNRKIVINLNNKNNFLLEKNEKLRKKIHLIETSNIIAISPFQNNNNININNFKIKNNNKNNMNLNIAQRKFQTGNNFYHPNLNKNNSKNNIIIDTISNDLSILNNPHKASTINRNNSNNNIRINNYGILGEKYSKKQKEYQILYNDFLKLRDKYNLDTKKYNNNINILKTKIKELNKIIFF